MVEKCKCCGGRARLLEHNERNFIMCYTCDYSLQHKDIEYLIHIWNTRKPHYLVVEACTLMLKFYTLYHKNVIDFDLYAKSISRFYRRMKEYGIV